MKSIEQLWLVKRADSFRAHQRKHFMLKKAYSNAHQYERDAMHGALEGAVLNGVGYGLKGLGKIAPKLEPIAGFSKWLIGTPELERWIVPGNIVGMAALDMLHMPRGTAQEFVHEHPHIRNWMLHEAFKHRHALRPVIKAYQKIAALNEDASVCASKSASTKYFLIKQALIGDRIGNFIGSHMLGGAIGQFAGNVGGQIAAQAFIPGVLSADSYAEAAGNMASLGRNLATGNYGSAAWDGAKTLWNGGIGTLGLVPEIGSGLAEGMKWAPKGIEWAAKGLEGLAGSNRAARYTNTAYQGLGGLAGKLVKTPFGKWMNHGASNFVGSNVLNAPNIYNGVKNWFGARQGMAAAESENRVAQMNSMNSSFQNPIFKNPGNVKMPGMLANNPFSASEKALGF